MRLCPHLNAHYRAIIDNGAFYASSETAQLIAATGGTLLFLAPYSPDLNPIEHDFAALKKRRKYQEQATLDDLVRGYHDCGLSYRGETPQPVQRTLGFSLQELSI